SLKAFPRAVVKRSRVRKLRATGRVPAIIYGRQTKPQNLEVGLKEIEDLIHHSVSETILVDLAVDGEAKLRRLALVQEVQHHPLSGKRLNINLPDLAENEKLTVTVRLETAAV